MKRFLFSVTAATLLALPILAAAQETPVPTRGGAPNAPHEEWRARHQPASPGAIANADASDRQAAG
jgi:hypothetical protein